MTEYEVGEVDEISPGERKITTVKGREIGIFNVNGRYCAVRNICPHQGAPLCLGTVGGTNVPSRPGQYIWGRQGEILRCPWHGWEFDLCTGVSLFDPQIRVKVYAVELRDQQLILLI